MSMRRAEILRLRLPCDVSAPRLARQAFEQATELGPVHDDALLVVSELTSNAVMHSGADERSEIELRAELVPEGIVIEVIDEGRSGTVPHARPADAGVPGGFGLPVVAAVARRWGSERLDRMRVWAEIPLGGAGPQLPA